MPIELDKNRNNVVLSRRAVTVLLDVTGVDNLDDAASIALGRPPGREPSKTRQVRLSSRLDAQTEALARKRGIPVSLLMREAIAIYVAEYIGELQAARLLLTLIY